MDRTKFVRDSITEVAEELDYPAMKPEQLDVAVHVAFVEGRDVFVILPTGFVKSWCYTCLPVAFDKIFKKSVGIQLSWL